MLCGCVVEAAFRRGAWKKEKTDVLKKTGWATLSESFAPIVLVKQPFWPVLATSSNIVCATSEDELSTQRKNQYIVKQTQGGDISATSQSRRAGKKSLPYLKMGCGEMRPKTK